MKNYLWIILSAASLGITSVLYKKSTEELGAINTTFFYYLFGALISLVVWLVAGKEKPLSLTGLLYPAGIAVFLFVSVLSFNFGLEKVDAGIATTIRSFSFVFALLASYFAFGETLNLKQIIGIVLAGVSLILLMG